MYKSFSVVIVSLALSFAVSFMLGLFSEIFLVNSIPDASTRTTVIQTIALMLSLLILYFVILFFVKRGMSQKDIQITAVIYALLAFAQLFMGYGLLFAALGALIQYYIVNQLGKQALQKGMPVPIQR